MNVIRETDTFSHWLTKVADLKSKGRILDRIRLARNGNFGDCKSLGGGISEMRIHYGPGYRIYYAQQEGRIFLLILGGAKNTQQRDIQKAKKLWKIIQEGGL